MKRIGIHGKDFQNKSTRFIEKVLDHLKKTEAEIWVSSKFLRQFKASQVAGYKLKTFELGDSLRPLDFFLSLGGDGTLLESVTYIGRTEVPIMGINTGRLGFLATNSPDDMEEAVDALINGDYRIDSRSVLKLTSTPKLFGNLNFALNDFTVTKKILLHDHGARLYGRAIAQFLLGRRSHRGNPHGVNGILAELWWAVG